MTRIIPAVLLSLTAFADLCAALPTGCPDFTVMMPQERQGAVIRAVDFGFSTSSDKNAAAIGRALDEARRIGAVRVELAPGTYRCYDEPAVRIGGFRDFTFDGKGAVLVFRKPPEFRGQPQSELVMTTGNVFVDRCERTLVENFTIDWDWQADPLAAFVRVRDRHIDEAHPENSYVELTFVDYDRYPKYPEPVPLQKVLPMDECRTRFRAGLEFSYGQTEGHFGAKNAWVAPNVLRVWPGIPMEGRNQNPMTGFYRPDPKRNLARVKAYEKDGFYRIQHCYYGKNGICLNGNRHLTIRGVTVWSCFGMAMVTDGPQEFWQVEDFKVVPPSREELAAAYPGVAYRPRPITSTSDGHHVARSKGSCRYLRCRWTLNNDDSSNFHDRITIAVRGSARVLDIVNRRGMEYFRVENGAEIELRRPNFDAIGFRAKVVRTAGNRIFVDRDLPEQQGQCFIVWDRTYGTDRVMMKDCVFEDSSFRNLFSSADLTIEGCTFRRTRGYPVRFIADYRTDLWCEGMGMTNLVVRNCTFEQNNTIDARWSEISAVCVTPTDWDVGRVKPGFVAGGVLIEGCSFVRPRGPVLDFECGRDIVFRNNRILLDSAAKAANPEAGTYKIAPDVVNFREFNNCVLTQEPRRVIFDTDMVEDYDDVGAVALLHALADEGRCEIVAMGTCTRDNSSVAAVEVLNAFYGRPEIPVGCAKGLGVIGVPNGDPKRPGHQKYVRLAREYAHWVRHADSDDAPDANAVYRKALAEAPDGSVVMCSVGFVTNMRRLLESKPDAISPLDGRSLVAKKVCAWYAMAGCLPNGCEYNVQHDAESARIAFADWPTPIVISDFRLGREVYAGRGVTERDYPYANPVKDIFSRCLPSRAATHNPKAWDRDEGGHTAWDETTVLAAVFGVTPHFDLVHGRMSVAADGKNSWKADPTCKGGYLKPADSRGYTVRRIGEIMDAYIARPPACRAQQP